MAGFRSHRSRFRREKLSNQIKNQEESCIFTSSLGQKLATFKHIPDPELEQNLNVFRSRPLFLGACGTCTLFSGATYLPDSIYNSSAAKNSLVGDLCKPTDSSPLVIDFEKSFKNSEYIKASLTELSNGNTGTSSPPILEDYVAKQNIQQDKEEPGHWYQRVKSWVIRKILNFLFPSGILYHPGQIQTLQRCSKSRSPFLFLPVHKSPLDSIVIKSVLAKTPNRLDLKTFVASRKSEIQVKPGFQMFENIVEDITWSVQQATVSSIFSNLGNILVFLEPEVCTEGRPNLAMDMNILDHTLQCLYDDVINDVQIVPIGISYQGTPVEKWPQSFYQLLKLFLGIWPSSQSYVRVDFDQPFSLKEFRGKWETRLSYRRVQESEMHHQVKSALASHSLYTSWYTCRFMLTDLLAFLSIGLEERKAKIDATKLGNLIEDIQMRNKFLGFVVPRSEDDLQAILDNCSYKTWLANASEAEREISAAHVKSLFFRESVTMSALGSLIKHPLRAYVGTNADVTVMRCELIDKSLLVFDLLTYEDHFALPCKDIHDVIDDTLQFLKHREIIYIKEEIRSEHFQERWARRMAQNLEREMFDEHDEDESMTDDVVFHVSTDPIVVEEMDFLIELMRPVFRSYYDLIKFVAQKNIDGRMCITDMVQKTPYSRDRVNRIVNWLQSKNVIEISEENYESFHITCKSFDKVLMEVRKLVL